MQLPLQITIRDIPHSTFLESHIRKKAQKLNSCCNQIIGCRIVVEAPQRHQHQGKLYNVHVDLTLPGEEVAITHHVDENVYIALRDAFNIARRKMEETIERQHGKGKIHMLKWPLRGQIVRLFPEDGYGFIEALDGHEIYFNAAVVKPNFKRLRLGTEVKFLEEMGNKGPQACRVRVLEHNGIHA